MLSEKPGVIPVVQCSDLFFVFPAQAGTHLPTRAQTFGVWNWVPAFAGMTSNVIGRLV